MPVPHTGVPDGGGQAGFVCKDLSLLLGSCDQPRSRGLLPGPGPGLWGDPGGSSPTVACMPTVLGQHQSLREHRSSGFQLGLFQTFCRNRLHCALGVISFGKLGENGSPRTLLAGSAPAGDRRSVEHVYRCCAC